MGRKRKDDGSEEKDPKVEAQEQAESEAAELQAQQAASEPAQGPEGEGGPDGQPQGETPQGEPQGGESEDPDEDFGAEAEASVQNKATQSAPIPGDKSLQSEFEGFNAEERRMIVEFVRALRSGRGNEAIARARDGLDRPPMMSEAEITEAQNRESEAIRAAGGPQVPEHRGMTGGETDPRSIPVLSRFGDDPRRAREDYRPAEGEQPQGTEDRPLTEGEVAANLSSLRATGDTAYQHPQYAAEARQRVMGPRGESGQKVYRIVGNYQVGAVAGPDRGGADRAYTITELGITESQVPRLLQKGVIVEEPQD